jgi:hypothetical protein
VRRRGLFSIILLSLVAVVALPGAAASEGRRSAPPPLLPAGTDALARALASGHIDAAHYALLRALSLFHPAQVAARYRGVTQPPPRDATLVLRDLALRLDELPAADRRVAERILARPTDGSSDPEENGYTVPEQTPVCSAHVCVHYVASTADAPNLADANADGIPDWVTRTLAVIDHVWSAEVGTYGYRAPLADTTSTNNGGDGRLDVYLANVGAEGLYGYCTTDDPHTPVVPYDTVETDWAVSAYCVVDDDFSPHQFPANTPLENLQVTAAHEFFHTVQFAYDFQEDTWLMEGTAVWMEDQVYTRVNDNRQYFPWSPLELPGSPLDRGISLYHYGAWIWWRYLSERFGPGIVRQVWRRADDSATGPKQYSTQATANTLAAHGVSLRDAFGDFAVWNRIPGRRYSEGTAYPVAPVTQRATLGPGAAVVTGTRRLKHLASVYASFRPSASAAATAHLTVRLDLPDSARHPVARLIVIDHTGAAAVHRFALSRTGGGTLRVRFGRGVVRRVDLVLSNAGTRFSCWQGTVFSCQGIPRDEGRTYAWRASYSRS